MHMSPPYNQSVFFVIIQIIRIAPAFAGGQGRDKPCHKQAIQATIKVRPICRISGNLQGICAVPSSTRVSGKVAADFRRVGRATASRAIRPLAECVAATAGAAAAAEAAVAAVAVAAEAVAAAGVGTAAGCRRRCRRSMSAMNMG